MTGATDPARTAGAVAPGATGGAKIGYCTGDICETHQTVRGGYGRCDVCSAERHMRAELAPMTRRARRGHQRGCDDPACAGDC